MEGLVREIVRWVELDGIAMFEKIHKKGVEGGVTLGAVGGVVGGEEVSATNWQRAEGGGIGVRAAAAKL